VNQEMKTGPNDANWQFRERSNPIAQIFLVLVALTALWLYIPSPT
jgi:hypothetical protein